MRSDANSGAGAEVDNDAAVEEALGELRQRFTQRVQGRAVDVRRQEEVDAFVQSVLDREALATALRRFDG